MVHVKKLKFVLRRNELYAEKCCVQPLFNFFASNTSGGIKPHPYPILVHSPHGKFIPRELVQVHVALSGADQHPNSCRLNELDFVYCERSFSVAAHFK